MHEWTIEDALVLIREIAPKLKKVGWYPSLAGSVLMKGYSDKDLDIVMIPHTLAEQNVELLRDVLYDLGWKCRVRAHNMVKFWREKGGTDSKHVDVWLLPDGSRVDVVIPSVKVSG